MSTSCREAEGVCAEDDSPLHEQGGEELDDLPCGESREEKVEVHVLETRVHGPTEGESLHS